VTSLSSPLNSPNNPDSPNDPNFNISRAGSESTPLKESVVLNNNLVGRVAVASESSGRGIGEQEYNTRRCADFWRLCSGLRQDVDNVVDSDPAFPILSSSSNHSSSNSGSTLERETAATTEKKNVDVKRRNVPPFDASMSEVCSPPSPLPLPPFHYLIT